ncbi:MAG TPA: hypothetical protein QF621_02055, partial [Candidatus Thalassarchaeaceae archaeon]|nr:hypothetical protein [Candidatus Thalassarchaeaceae archaeon]
MQKNLCKLYLALFLIANHFDLEGIPKGCMEWDVSAIEGPDGDDWRVPTEELAQRIELASSALSEAGIEAMLVHD